MKHSRSQNIIFWNTHKVVENLVAYDASHLEALLAGDRVDDHVSVNADEMLRVEDAIFILNKSELVSCCLTVLSLPVWTCNEGMLGRWAERVWRGVGMHMWGEQNFKLRTCPAVSMISVANSWFLYRITLLNVFSMVG